MSKQYAPLPSEETILSHFRFEWEKGELYWRGGTECTKYLNDKLVGAVAGHRTHKGYLRVKLEGRNHLVHRLVFKLVHGRDPAYEIDHKDLDRSNNRPGNLREATPTENTWNRPNKRRKYDYPKGVIFHRRTGRFHARIQIHGGRRHLGCFDTVEAAAAAYAAASREHHGEFGRTA